MLSIENVDHYYGETFRPKAKSIHMRVICAVVDGVIDREDLSRVCCTRQRSRDSLPSRSRPNGTTMSSVR